MLRRIDVVNGTDCAVAQASALLLVLVFLLILFLIFLLGAGRLPRLGWRRLLTGRRLSSLLLWRRFSLRRRLLHPFLRRGLAGPRRLRRRRLIALWLLGGRLNRRCIHLRRLSLRLWLICP